MLALIAYMQRDNDRAVAEIRQANLQKFSIYHAIAAIIYAERGLMAEARRAGARFVEMRPTFLANLDAELAQAQLAARGSGAPGRGPAQGGPAGARGGGRGSHSAARRFVSVPTGARPHCRLQYHPPPTLGWSLE